MSALLDNKPTSLLLVTCLLLTTGLCPSVQASSEAATTPAEFQDGHEHEDSQEHLLDIAFRSASALPLMPHVKSRSRAQEEVALACLELHRPELAAEYAAGIENWRRGKVYGDIACYWSREGDAERAKRFVERAQEVLDRPREEFDQAWRFDRIRARIAAAHLLLGRREEADRWAKDLADSEVRSVEAVRASFVPEGSVSSEVRNLEDVALNGTLDEIRTTLSRASVLYDRFYEKEELRQDLEDRMRRAWAKVPLEIRFDLMMEMVDASIRWEDLPRAESLLAETRRFLEETRWRAADHASVWARYGIGLHGVGRQDEAHAVLGEALATYDERVEEILGIYRTPALLPLAEAFLAVGDEAVAGKLYRRALEMGGDNPNGRPRAENLSMTCCSMAVQAFVPGDALWERIAALYNGLQEPW